MDSLADWVSVGLLGKVGMFKNCRCLAALRDNQIVAGVVYHNYIEDINDKPLFCEMSIYSIDRKWATRHNLKRLFAYPFIQLKLERVQAICSANDEGVIMFLKKLGFTKEGHHRKAHHDGGDAISFGMLKSECKWL